MAVVHLEDIAVRIMGRWVLSGINAQVHLGNRILLTGPNGAGKTTLLRVIATALRPQHGRLGLFDGHSPGHLRASRPRLALMTHHHYFYEPLTAVQNLRLVAQLVGATNEKHLETLLQEVGLWGHHTRPIVSFSAGMKRRLALARVQLLRPDLVLLDEPFGQLDPEGVTLMESALMAMAKRGATTIMATHDIARGEALTHLRWHLPANAQGLICTAPGGLS